MYACPAAETARGCGTWRACPHGPPAAREARTRSFATSRGGRAHLSRGRPSEMPHLRRSAPHEFEARARQFRRHQPECRTQSCRNCHSCASGRGYAALGSAEAATRPLPSYALRNRPPRTCVSQYLKSTCTCMENVCAQTVVLGGWGKGPQRADGHCMQIWRTIRNTDVVRRVAVAPHVKRRQTRRSGRHTASATNAPTRGLTTPTTLTLQVSS